MSTPRFYVRILVELEDFVNEQWDDKEARKIMSKANSKGLTALRQKIRKYNKVMVLSLCKNSNLKIMLFKSLIIMNSLEFYMFRIWKWKLVPTEQNPIQWDIQVQITKMKRRNR